MTLKSFFIAYLENAAEESFSVSLKKTYERACRSLKAYPLDLTSAEEAKILKGVTPAVASELESALRKRGGVTSVKRKSGKVDAHSTTTRIDANALLESSSSTIQSSYSSTTSDYSAVLHMLNQPSASLLNTDSRKRRKSSSTVVDLCTPSPVPTADSSGASTRSSSRKRSSSINASASPTFSLSPLSPLDRFKTRLEHLSPPIVSFQERLNTAVDNATIHATTTAIPSRSVAVADTRMRIDMAKPWPPHNSTQQMFDNHASRSNTTSSTTNSNVYSTPASNSLQAQPHTNSGTTNSDLTTTQQSTTVVSSTQSSSTHVTASSKPYRPRKGSANWAVIMLLSSTHDDAQTSWLTRAQITSGVVDSKMCQKFSWKSVLDLVDRGIVHRHAEMTLYGLTDAGVQVADFLKGRTRDSSRSASTSMPPPPPRKPNEQVKRTMAQAIADTTTPSPLKRVAHVLHQSSDEFDVFDGQVILLLDSRELNNHSRLALLLGQRGVAYESRQLNLADMMFVLRCNTVSTESPSKKRRIEYQHEFVMNYAAERKELSDFMSSVTDGRYVEQKYRLKRCGLTNIVYLVEGRLDASLTITRQAWDTRLKRYNKVSKIIPSDTIKTAMMSTQINDGFHVRTTASLDETADYLAKVYHFVCLHRPMFRVSCESSASTRFVPFTEFNAANAKGGSVVVQHIFVKQLMQIQGCSAARAKAIVDVYPTVGALLQAYAACDDQVQCEKLLASLHAGATRLGPVLSKAIYHFFWGQ